MTKKSDSILAQQRVCDCLKLWESNGYIRLEHDNKHIYFYRQVNPEIGVLVVYFNFKNKFGGGNKHYNQHCFDLYIHLSSSMEQAILQDLGQTLADNILEFWIPCFNPYNERHIEVVEHLGNELEVDSKILNNKYKTILNQNS